jgi:hypothetical protein
MGTQASSLSNLATTSSICYAYLLGSQFPVSMQIAQASKASILGCCPWHVYPRKQTDLLVLLSASMLLHSPFCCSFPLYPNGTFAYHNTQGQGELFILDTPPCCYMI